MTYFNKIICFLLHSKLQYVVYMVYMRTNYSQLLKTNSNINWDNADFLLVGW